MNILIAADKFKGSLNSQEIGSVIETGIRSVFKSSDLPDPDCHVMTVADGGEGFLQAVTAALLQKRAGHSATGRPKPTHDLTAVPNDHELESIPVMTVDPRGRPIEAYYIWDRSNQIAFIELASASGLSLLETGQRNPELTSTFGSGVMMRDAVTRGARQILMGIGGSATNDAGTGIAAALGCVFRDARGQVIQRPTGEQLLKIERFDDSRMIRLPEIISVNDVNNPLYGPQGAAYTFAEQKGATTAQIKRLDAGLRHLASRVAHQRELLPPGDEHPAMTPGAGAAGGVGYGLLVFCHGSFRSGAKLILQLSGIQHAIEARRYDLIVTGEGKIDRSTSRGKLVGSIASLGQQNQIPVVAFCGQNDLPTSVTHALGLSQVIPIHDPQKRTVLETIAQTGPLLQLAASKWMAHRLRQNTGTIG